MTSVRQAFPTKPILGPMNNRPRITLPGVDSFFDLGRIDPRTNNQHSQVTNVERTPMAQPTHIQQQLAQPAQQQHHHQHQQLVAPVPQFPPHYHVPHYGAQALNYTQAASYVVPPPPPVPQTHSQSFSHPSPHLQPHPPANSPSPYPQAVLDPQQHHPQHQIIYFQPQLYPYQQAAHPQHHPQILQQQQPVMEPVSKQAIAWTREDDKLLRHLKEEKKMGWKEIANYFPTRTPNACQFRWRRIIAGIVTTTSSPASSPTTTSPPLQQRLSLYKNSKFESKNPSKLKDRHAI